MNKRVVIFVSSVNMVAQVVEHSIFFPPDVFVQVCPLDTPAVRVSLCNIPPFIKDTQLVNKLNKHGSVVSSVTMIPSRGKNNHLKHIMSFRRFVCMTLPRGVTSLNAVLPFKVNGYTYRVFVSTESLVCFECGQYSHLKDSCPNISTGGVTSLADDVHQGATEITVDNVHSICAESPTVDIYL